MDLILYSLEVNAWVSISVRELPEICSSLQSLQVYLKWLTYIDKNFPAGCKYIDSDEAEIYLKYDGTA